MHVRILLKAMKVIQYDCNMLKLFSCCMRSEIVEESWEKLMAFGEEKLS